MFQNLGYDTTVCVVVSMYGILKLLYQKNMKLGKLAFIDFSIIQYQMSLMD